MIYDVFENTSVLSDDADKLRAFHIRLYPDRKTRNIAKVIHDIAVYLERE